MITALVTVMVIAVIGLVISIVINVFLIVQCKQSRYVVTSIHSMLTICCRYDVNQSNSRYSDVKQSVSRDHTIKMPSLLSRQSMRLLQLIINLTVMLKWMLILLIKQLVSLVRSL